PTLQVVLDALKLTSFYKAFEIIADVPEIYMQEFWVTVSRHHSLLRFKMNGKSHTVNVDYFRDMLQICPKIPGQKFKDPPVEEEIPSFARELEHTDLVFQVKNKNSKKNNYMYYLRFTKVIIDYFMANDKAIPRRNKMFWHFARDDSLFTIIRVIFKHQDTQIYGALLPQYLTNQAILDSEAYKTYHAYATGEKTPKPKYVQKKADSDTSPKKKHVQAPKGKRLKATAKKSSDNEEDDDDQSDDDGDSQGDDDQDDDNEQTESDNNGDDFLHPKLSTFDEKERHDKKQDEKEEDSDLRVETPSHFKSTDDEAYDDVTQGVNVKEEKLDEDMINEED
nr:hypothetical protein [Tanacetum cinerariifolium]